jgi:hypothetical protein
MGSNSLPAAAHRIVLPLPESRMRAYFIWVQTHFVF